MNYNELLAMTATLGSSLLENGAEIYRVEESIGLIFKAYGLLKSDVFAIPSCIFVTITDPDGHSYTRVLRVASKGINLRKVELFNDLCRTICSEKPDFDDVNAKIVEINNVKTFGFLPQIAARAIIASAFTLFFGGTFVDAACALICGAAIKLTGSNLQKFNTNNFFTNILSSAAASVIAVIFFRIGVATHLDKIIIGSLMNLVPGMAITNMMRDMITGDLFTGVAKLAESLLVAMAIAIGAGLALALSRLVGG